MVILKLTVLVSEGIEEGSYGHSLLSRVFKRTVMVIRFISDCLYEKSGHYSSVRFFAEAATVF